LVLETVAYGRGSFGESVKQALNIDGSERRKGILEGIVRMPLIGGDERRRTDVDFMFLAASPTEARQILPQVRYFGATSVPIYATSDAFTGTRDPALDRDLDGLIVGDMPWILGASGSPDDGRTANRAAGLERLFAFGMDAYLLLQQLGRLSFQSNSKLNGHTGLLSVAAGNRIRRQLSWARFQNGIPAPLAGDLRLSAPNSAATGALSDRTR
jgi:hypothetical protein